MRVDDSSDNQSLIENNYLAGPMEIVLIIVFIISSGIQAYFWIIQLDRFNRQDACDKDRPSHFPDVTVVIAARNELTNLEKHIYQWLNQKYRNFEVVIVDDHSSDGSPSFLTKTAHPNLRVLRLPAGMTGKKSALAYAIDRCSTSWVITTDADCCPESEYWIRDLMAGHEDCDVILGYSPHRTDKNVGPGYIISYETWYIAMQYFSAAILGRAYMGVGRNIAFRKSKYDSVGGYGGHMDLISGDDDLLISSFDSTTRYGIATRQSTWTWTYPADSFSDYFRQKRRHLTTAPRYKIKTRLWLSAVYISQLAWYVSFFCLCFVYPWVFALFLIRAAVIAGVSYRSKGLLGHLSKYWLAPVYDLIICVFYLFFSVTFLYPTKKW